VNHNNELAQLALRVSSIEERNRRVELEKAWELSLTRKVSILALTYLVMILVFWSLGNTEYALNAIVPTLGFFLSTISLPKAKVWWQKSKDFEALRSCNKDVDNRHTLS
jgi:hypothetical protein